MAYLLYLVGRFKVIVKAVESVARMLRATLAQSYFGKCLDRKTYSRLALYIFSSSILKSLREAHTHLKAAK